MREIINQVYYHASGLSHLTLDRIDFNIRVSEDWPAGLAVTKAEYGRETEWSNRSHLYELLVTGRAFDLSDDEDFRRYSPAITQPSDKPVFFDRLVKESGVDVICLSESAHVITNRSCVRAFRRVR